MAVSKRERAETGILEQLRGALQSGEVCEAEVKDLLRATSSDLSHVASGEEIPPAAKQSKRKPRKAFDMSKYRQRHIALRILYFGEGLRGFASVTAEVDEETVEGLLFGTLVRLRLIESRKHCAFARSGRTDKGVSAFGQVVSLRVRSKALITVSLPTPVTCGQESCPCW
jgi:tRNA pseudouridine38/39 synthase